MVGNETKSISHDKLSYPQDPGREFYVHILGEYDTETGCF